MDALRFAHAAQVALLFQRWPPDAALLAGATEAAADGRLLFAGPRVAMALHHTQALECALPLPCSTDQRHRFALLTAPACARLWGCCRDGRAVLLHNVTQCCCAACMHVLSLFAALESTLNACAIR